MHLSICRAMDNQSNNNNIIGYENRHTARDTGGLLAFGQIAEAKFDFIYTSYTTANVHMLLGYSCVSLNYMFVVSIGLASSAHSELSLSNYNSNNKSSAHKCDFRTSRVCFFSLCFSSRPVRSRLSFFFLSSSFVHSFIHFFSTSRAVLRRLVRICLHPISIPYAVYGAMSS